MANNKIEQPIKQIRLKNKGPIRALDVSPDGLNLLVGQNVDRKKNSNLSIWSIDNWAYLQEIKTADPQSILMARYSNDGQKIVFVDTGMFPFVHDFDTQTTSRLAIDNESVRWLSSASQSPYLVVAGELTQIFNLDQKKVLWTYPDKAITNDSEEVLPLIASLNADSSKIATAGGKDKKVTIHNLKNKKDEKTFKTDFNDFQWISFDHQDKYLAAIALYGDRTYLWEIATGHEILTDVFNEEATGYWSLRFHPNGNFLALGMRTGYVVMLRISDGAYVIDNHAHRGQVHDLCFTPDGRYLITGGMDGIAHIWDLEPIL